MPFKKVIKTEQFLDSTLPWWFSVKGCVIISTNHCGGNFLHCSPPAAAAQFNNNTPRSQQQQEQQKRAQAAFNTVHQLSAAVCGVSAGYYCYCLQALQSARVLGCCWHLCCSSCGFLYIDLHPTAFQVSL